MTTLLWKMCKRVTTIAVVMFACAGAAAAEGTAKDFVRLQAGKAALIADAEKIEFLAGEVFRFQMLGVMRMTHVGWQFEEDGFLRDHGHTYGYKIRGASEDVGYEATQLTRSISRNKSVDESQKVIASDLMALLLDLVAQSTELGVLYDNGDAGKAGHFFYSKIYPTFQSIRKGVYSLNSDLGKEMKLEALKFK